LNNKQTLTEAGVGDNEVCGIELEFAKLDDVEINTPLAPTPLLNPAHGLFYRL
jgi:hypothetical protein